MAASEKRRVSVLNWMGTLVLYAIPGVNLVMLILTIIFSKVQAKRAFAMAGIWLMVICAGILVAAMLFLPDQMLWLAQWLRGV